MLPPLLLVNRDAMSHVPIALCTGAFAMLRNNMYVSFVNSFFDSNTAGMDGGAVNSDTSNNYMTLAGVGVSNNLALRDGDRALTEPRRQARKTLLTHLTRIQVAGCTC